MNHEKMIRIPSLWLLHFLCCIHPFLVASLSTKPSSASCDRRKFVSNNIVFSTTVRSLILCSTSFVVDKPASASEIKVNPSKDQFEQISSLLKAKSISWEGPRWTFSRYRSSTLSSVKPSPDTSSSTEETITTAAPAPIATLPISYPPWMEGYFTIQYKFTGASFPQGKNILSIRTAGAGLGTCLSLPNVGYSPRSAFAVRFLKQSNECNDSNENGNSGGNPRDGFCDGGSDVYEDLAYNYPRRLEAFWPDAKVLAVQTNGGNDAMQIGNAQSPKQDQAKTKHRQLLSPKCFVTGDGCTSRENPDLHSSSSRIRMEFEAPTRRSGRMRQSTDVTLLVQRRSTIAAGNEEDCNSFGVVKTYSQWNEEQDIQTFYEEISTYKLLDNARGKGLENENGKIILGNTRVAAFLPKFVKALDNDRSMKRDDLSDYKEEEAVALYDYKFVMNRIDEADASSI